MRRRMIAGEVPGRRGQAEMVEWFTRLILLVVAAVVIATLVRVYTNRDVDAPELARAAYLYRISYGDAIMYKDATTGRIYPGIVDMGKFTSERLDGVFVEREPGEAFAKISSSLTITPASGCVIKERTIHNNKDTYDRYLAFANTLQGAGGATSEAASYPVTLRDGEALCPGILNITIVRPNS